MEFYLLLEIWRKSIDKNISKNLNSKYSQKLLDHAKQPARYALKTASTRVIQITAVATDDLIGNNIADKMTKFSKTSPQNNSVTNEEEIRRYISPKERLKVIHDLRLIQ